MMEEYLKEDKFSDVDLPFGKLFEKKLLEVFLGEDDINGSFKTEVKAERDVWEETGNIFIEYSSRGQDSGIKTTTSKYWFVFLTQNNGTPYSDVGVIFDTKVLYAYLHNGMVSGTLAFNVKGGDIVNGEKSSRGVLLPINRIQDVAKFRKFML